MASYEESRLNSTVPPASLVAFAGSSVPSGWLICDGSAVSRTDYADLFSAIGTTWGVGDGSTTFNVPELGGRMLKGAGSITDGSGGDSVALGEFQDDTTATNGLTSPSHNHGQSWAYISDKATIASSPGGNAATSAPFGTASSVGDVPYAGKGLATRNISTGGRVITIDGDTETRPKVYGVNYIIKI